MAYSAKSQAEYNKKCVRLAIKYTLNEQKDSNNLKAYLEQTGQSANSYIKNLIKKDLASKGFSVDSVTTIDMKSLESNNDTDNT